ncbi:hypothetical protein L1887_59779 [Cichorium endivia]|nr:hypothetical protein L1887_59833 [Cichorium endivia]KAI3478303.1 hypothetical protein L1887_59779 [Cichorium endivia]
MRSRGPSNGTRSATRQDEGREEGGDADAALVERTLGGDLSCQSMTRVKIDLGKAARWSGVVVTSSEHGYPTPIAAAAEIPPKPPYKPTATNSSAHSACRTFFPSKHRLSGTPLYCHFAVLHSQHMSGIGGRPKAVDTLDCAAVGQRNVIRREVATKYFLLFQL